MILREGPKTIDVEFDRPSIGTKFCGRRDADTLVRCGPTLPILVGFDPAYDAKIADSFPDLPGDETTARVDTGAQVSCIDRALVQRLKLPFLREGAIATIHQLNKADEYHAQVRIDCLGCTVWGSFREVRMVLGQPPVLLGRDFLKRFTMVYDGHSGSVTLSPAEQ